MNIGIKPLALAALLGGAALWHSDLVDKDKAVNAVNGAVRRLSGHLVSPFPSGSPPSAGKSGGQSDEEHGPRTAPASSTGNPDGGQNVRARGPPDSAAYDPSSLIVRFEPNLPEAVKAAARALAGAGVSHNDLLKALDIELLKLPNVGLDLEAILTALQKSPFVKYVEYNYKIELDGTGGLKDQGGSASEAMAAWAKEFVSSQDAIVGVTADSGVDSTLTPKDPKFGDMWGLKGGYGSNSVGAWSKGHFGSRDVIVGVIDTGIDYNHPDLKANMWKNPKEIPGDGIDNDGNGYVDDIYGIDAHNNDSDPMDDRGHGTHCAGTIGAVGNNNVGVVGVNWNVKMIAGKFLGDGKNLMSNAIIAIDYMTNLKLAGNNIRVLSNSWGCDGCFSEALLDSINRAGDADILFVAAAGNKGWNTDTIQYYPQMYKCVTKGDWTRRGWDCVVSVASVTSSGAMSSFSNYGQTTVDIGAPGSNILSTIPNNQYGIMSGTSMAAPHVSGALAMCAATNPKLTARQLKEYLMRSAAPTPSMERRTVSGGRLDVSRLMDLCGNGGLVWEVLPGGAGRPRLTWTAKTNDGRSFPIGASPGTEVGIARLNDVSASMFQDFELKVDSRSSGDYLIDAVEMKEVDKDTGKLVSKKTWGVRNEYVWCISNDPTAWDKEEYKFSCNCWGWWCDTCYKVLSKTCDKGLRFNKDGKVYG